MAKGVVFNGFEWDKGNGDKCRKHGVSIAQIEDLFARPVALFPDEAHSGQEIRYRAVGRTKSGRAVFLVFTLREREDGLFLRPISARFMHEKEVKAYEEENPDL